MPPERLQKLLAAAGFGSRRACEDLIGAGRVRVNGAVAHIGDKADPVSDRVTLDGVAVEPEAPVYIMLNKPRGVVSSLRAQGDRPTVRDLVSARGRLYPVGRLDTMSEGLILLTNDGELTNRITHPRYGHEKEYRVLVLSPVRPEALQTWRRGLVIKDEDGKSERTGPAQVEIGTSERTGDGAWLRVVMREGKKHQIRRIGEALGMYVARIVRVRIGTLLMGTLKTGEWRHLTPAELRGLLAATGSPVARAPRK
ncbi:MAG: rRNA pseudouridine synthase [Chloroflexi bacterium]|nr:rRNA pseudouridine synthase [Chloroflexota bacterium]